jgi:hypothetical protein
VFEKLFIKRLLVRFKSILALFVISAQNRLGINSQAYIQSLINQTSKKFRKLWLIRTCYAILYSRKKAEGSFAVGRREEKEDISNKLIE